VDIIIEGQITTDEGMGEVLQTVIDLKNLTNPILRLTSNVGELQGRVSFSKGHILGGRINNTDEVGYPAIRKLFSITNGNYAILDPGRAHQNEVNQSLWIEAEKLIALLPNLPAAPDGLMDVNPDEIAHNRPKFDAIDLRVGTPSEGQPGTKVSKGRSFDEGTWFFFKLGMWTLGTLIVVAVIVQYWEPIEAHLRPLLVH
jgi:hypothetical protein